MLKHTVSSLVLTAVVLIIPATARGQASGPESSTIEHNPGVILNRLLDGPQVTETDPNPEDRLPGLLAFGITGLFAAIQQIIPVLPFEAILGIGDPDNPGGGGTQRIVLTEVANNGDNTFIEVSNPGGLRLDLDDWAICIDADTRDCQFLTGLTLDPNPPQSRTSLVLQLGGDPDPEILDTFLFVEVAPSQGEVALFDFGPLGAADPLNSSALRAYLTWGPQLLNPTQLQNVAIDASLWRRLETISPDEGLRDLAFQLNTSQLQIGGRNANDYTVVPFGNNTLGSTSVGSPGDSGEGTDMGTGTDTNDGGSRGGRSRSAFGRRDGR